MGPAGKLGVAKTPDRPLSGAYNEIGRETRSRQDSWDRPRGTESVLLDELHCALGTSPREQVDRQVVARYVQSVEHTDNGMNPRFECLPHLLKEFPDSLIWAETESPLRPSVHGFAVAEVSTSV